MDKKGKQPTKHGLGSRKREPAEQKTGLSTFKVRLLTLACIVAIMAIVVGIVGCAPQQAAQTSGDSEASSMEEFVAMFQADYGPGDPNQLVTLHAEQGYDCVDCHATPDTTSMNRESCFSSDCHDMQAIVAATDDYEGYAETGRSSSFGGELYSGVNPHRSHMDELADCSDCHSSHGQSVMSCNDCHYLTLPAGWTDKFDGKGAGMP